MNNKYQASHSSVPKICGTDKVASRPLQRKKDKMENTNVAVALVCPSRTSSAPRSQTNANAASCPGPPETKDMYRRVYTVRAYRRRGYRKNRPVRALQPCINESAACLTHAESRDNLAEPNTKAGKTPRSSPRPRFALRVPANHAMPLCEPQ